MRAQKKLMQNPEDHCIYAKKTKHWKVTIIKGVDDLMIVADDEGLMKDEKDKFKMKDLGKVKHVLVLISLSLIDV